MLRQDVGDAGGQGVYCHHQGVMYCRVVVQGDYAAFISSRGGVMRSGFRVGFRAGFFIRVQHIITVEKGAGHILNDDITRSIRERAYTSTYEDKAVRHTSCPSLRILYYTGECCPEDPNLCLLLLITNT
jgi:hypothetical protein